MNDEHEIRDTPEIITTPDKVLHKQRTAKVQPRLFGDRGIDRAWRGGLLALLAVLHFLATPDVQHALSQVAVRWLDTLASTGNAANSQKKGGE